VSENFGITCNLALPHLIKNTPPRPTGFAPKWLVRPSLMVVTKFVGPVRQDASTFNTRGELFKLAMNLGGRACWLWTPKSKRNEIESYLNTFQTV
jgi:hypothetical protein